MTRPTFSLLAAAVTLTGLGGVVFAVELLRRHVPVPVTRLAGILLIAYAGVLVVRPAGWAFMNAAVLAGAAGGVLLLERGLRTPGSVALFLVVAAVVDIVSMSGGLTRMLIERHRTGASNLLLYLTLVVPIGGRLVPIVGIGDLVVGGAAAAALIRLGLRRALVIGTISAGLLGALAYGLWRGGAPAVPFIAAAVVVLVGWMRRGGAADAKASAAPTG
jgi:hypothetical protein